MSVVHLGSRKINSDKSDGAVNCNEGSAEVIQLSARRESKGISPIIAPVANIHNKIHNVLTQQGVDFGCEKVRSDYQIVAYVVQGMLDRSNGEKSDRSMFLELIHQAFDYSEEPPYDDTTELFGDLLSQLD